MTAPKFRLENLFKTQLKIFRIVGVQFEYGNDKWAMFAKFRVYWTLIVVFLINILLQFYYNVMNFNKLEKVVETVAPISTATVVMIKIGSVYFMRNTIKVLIQDLILVSKKSKIITNSDLFIKG